MQRLRQRQVRPRCQQGLCRVHLQRARRHQPAEKDLEMHRGDPQRGGVEGLGFPCEEKCGELVGPEVAQRHLHPFGQRIERLPHRCLIGVRQTALGREEADEAVAGGIHHRTMASTASGDKPRSRRVAMARASLRFARRLPDSSSMRRW